MSLLTDKVELMTKNRENIWNYDEKSAAKESIIQNYFGCPVLMFEILFDFRTDKSIVYTDILTKIIYAMAVKTVIMPLGYVM